MDKDIGVLQAKVDQRLAQLLSLEAEKASVDNALKEGMSKPSAQKLLKKIARDIRSTKLLYGNAAGRLKEAQELQKQEASSRRSTTAQTFRDTFPESSASGSTTIGGENVQFLGQCNSSEEMHIDNLEQEAGSQTVVPPSGMFPPEPMEVSDNEGTFRRLDRNETQESNISDSPDMLDDLLSGSTSIHDESEMVLVTDDDKVALQRRLDGLKRRVPLKAPLKPKQKVKYVEIDLEESGVADNGPAKEQAVVIKPNIGDKTTLAATSKGQGKGRKKERATTNDNGIPQEYQPSQHKVEKAGRTAEVIAKKRVRAGDEESQMHILETWLSAVRNHTEKPPIPFPTRDLARKDSEYLARITTSDPRLAVELLENSWHNFLCVYHVSQDRKPVSEVNNLQGPIKIFGIPLPRNQNASPQGTITRVPGHLHCGCDERVALAGFVIWKTWKVKALIEGKLVIEGLNKPFHPRQVLFLLQFLKSKFGYVVEDMFTNSTDEGEEMRKEANVMEKVANFCARRRWELIGEKMELNYNIDNDVEFGEPQWV